MHIHVVHVYSSFIVLEKQTVQGVRAVIVTSLGTTFKWKTFSTKYMTVFGFYFRDWIGMYKMASSTPKKTCVVPIHEIDISSIESEVTISGSGTKRLDLHSCEECNFSTKSKFNLARHKDRFHNTSRGYHTCTCAICDKRYRNKENLDSHVKLSHNN